jgi:hypothetical protein
MQGTRNLSDGLRDIPVYKQDISPQNYKLPNLHASIYPTRSQPSCNLISSNNTKKHHNLTIKHVDPFKHCDTLVNNQIKRDKQGSRIHPLLRQLDSLAQNNLDNNKQFKKQHFVRTTYP